MKMWMWLALIAVAAVGSWFVSKEVNKDCPCSETKPKVKVDKAVKNAVDAVGDKNA